MTRVVRVARRGKSPRQHPGSGHYRDRDVASCIIRPRSGRYVCSRNRPPCHVRHYRNFWFVQPKRTCRRRRLRATAASSAAYDNWPGSSASIRSFSTTPLPPSTFTNIAPRGIVAKVRAQSMPSVSLVSGNRQTAISVCCRNDSSWLCAVKDPERHLRIPRVANPGRDLEPKRLQDERRRPPPSCRNRGTRHAFCSGRTIVDAAPLLPCTEPLHYPSISR